MASRSPEALAKRRETTRRWKREHPEAVRRHNREAATRYRAANAEKSKARTLLNTAIRDGKIQRGACWCGEVGEAHHDDYSRPYEVRWLCKAHHEEEHHQ